MDTASKTEKTEQVCMNSLRTRLLIAWAVFIALTLGLTDWGLGVLFERSITRRTEAELSADLRQVVRGMDVKSDGAVDIIRAPTDPQFDLLSGGRYWQVMEGRNVLARSASLEGFTIEAPLQRKDQSVNETHALAGPDGQQLFAVVRDLAVGEAAGPEKRKLTVLTAVDASEIAEDTAKFGSDLHLSLASLAALLLLGAWVHVRIGLQPLESLRIAVAAVREKKSKLILDGRYPDEVMPLVRETNALLSAQEDQIRQARQRAGDLAHGLKTPMAVMSAKGRQLRRIGHPEIADEIEQQVQAMNRHVQWELARARVHGSGKSVRENVDVAALTEALVSVIQCLPRGQELRWDCELPSRLPLAVDAEDFNTLTGNLLENAQKWAATRISIVARKANGGAEIVIEDDGPGIPEGEMQRVLRRGERADTSVNGSGLGLAIVSDTVEQYSGVLELSRSRLGGLKAVVTLPG